MPVLYCLLNHLDNIQWNKLTSKVCLTKKRLEKSIALDVLISRSKAMGYILRMLVVVCDSKCVCS